MSELSEESLDYSTSVCSECGEQYDGLRIYHVCKIVKVKDVNTPEDCKGCAYNWGSFNTQPDDSYCYMFSDFMKGCRKYTGKL